MAELKKWRKKESGFSLPELSMVLVGVMILLGIAVPALHTVMSQYRLSLAAQSIVTQLQFVRMKSVTSNESFRLNFPAGQRFYQVETSAGTLIAGPFYLPNGINLNTTDPGLDVSFGGRYVSFSPTGDASTVGNGSAGRARIINQVGGRIDIVVGIGGIIRQTPVYKSPPAPF